MWTTHTIHTQSYTQILALLHVYIHNTQTLMHMTIFIASSWCTHSLSSIHITWTQILNESRLLQIQGDLEDLEAALGATPTDLGSRAQVLGSGSCSALVKLLPGYKELYVAHDTWGDYNQMLRIFKHYDLHFDIGGGFRKSINES